MREYLYRNSDKCIFLIALFFYMFSCCYKLTYSSLWFDESVEYWISKIMFGPIDFFIGTQFDGKNMYERIILTYQPPLYNFLCYFWLKINDSEFWFRFFGVICGFIGIIGQYKSVKALSNSVYASFSIILTAVTYRYIYYIQECSEYCLLFATIPWSIYFIIKLMEKVNKYNILCFTICSIIPVYCQYGAIFTYAALLLVAGIYIFYNERFFIKNYFFSIIAQIMTLLCPLYIFFIQPQKNHLYDLNQQLNGDFHVSFEHGILKDYIHNFISLLQWNMFDGWHKDFVYGVVAFVIISIIISLINKANNKFIYLCAITFLSYNMLYAFVKLGLYANTFYGGGFTSRYTLFMLPLFFIIIPVSFFVIENAMCSNTGKIFHLVMVCFFIFNVVLGIHSWKNSLYDHWNKDNIREVVKLWQDYSGYDKYTLFDFTSISGFEYYNREFNDRNKDNEHILFIDFDSYRNSKIVYDDYDLVNRFFIVDNLPINFKENEIFYVVSNHCNYKITELLCSYMEKIGYENNTVFSQNGAVFIIFSKI